jgi:hypothetical protein
VALAAAAAEVVAVFRPGPCTSPPSGRSLRGRAMVRVFRCAPFGPPSCLSFPLLPFPPTSGVDLCDVIAAARAVASPEALSSADLLQSFVRENAVFVDPLPAPPPDPSPVRIRASEPPPSLCQADLALALAAGACFICPSAILLFVGLMFWVWKSGRAKVRLVHDMRASTAFFP